MNEKSKLLMCPKCHQKSLYVVTSLESSKITEKATIRFEVNCETSYCDFHKDISKVILLTQMDLRGVQTQIQQLKY